MSLFAILWLCGVLAEAGVIVACIRGKLFRTAPVFCLYIAWSMLIDVLLFPLRLISPAAYDKAYVPQMIVDSSFQFAVLVELGWAVLRPIRASLPRYSIVILALMITIAGGIIWPIAASTFPTNIADSGRFLVHIQDTFAVLRVVVFLALAAFSQRLGIGWRNRGLEIATGLGRYSMVSRAISLVHAHQSIGPYYEVMDQIGVAGYALSLVYWVFSFSQREEVRQNFSPQMQSVLLFMAGATRASRMAVTESAGSRPRKPNNP